MRDHTVSNMFMTSLIADDYKSRVIYKEYNGVDPPSAKDNLVRLHIYYESFTYQLMKELPGYTMSRLWANFGGAVGLYLGMTAAGAIEILHLFALLVVNCCCGKNAKNKSVEDFYKMDGGLL